jgi:catechol 2,3-dioxygenase
MQDSSAPARGGYRSGGYRIAAGTRIGHIQLRVADLDGAVEFYRDVLGFNLSFQGSALSLEAVQSSEETRVPEPQTGQAHLLILYPDLLALTEAVRRLAEHDYPIHSGQNHAGTISVYLGGPEGNDIELYYDGPRREWFNVAGTPVVQLCPDEREQESHSADGPSSIAPEQSPTRPPG